MIMSKDLLLAILSMDSYNRGYGAGIDGLGGEGTTLGTVAVSKSSSQLFGAGTDQAAGFFAISYDTIYGTVISYRGTNANTAANFLTDLFNSYGTAPGSPANDQAHLAAEFYQAVTGTTGGDPRGGDVILTGHSLGGGLAANCNIPNGLAA